MTDAEHKLFATLADAYRILREAYHHDMHREAPAANDLQIRVRDALKTPALPTEIALLVELRAMVHLSKTLNDRQHAGLSITSAMWSQLYDVTNRAASVIAVTAEH